MNAHRTLLPNTGTKARTPAELSPTNQPARYDKRKAKPLPNGSLPPGCWVGGAPPKMRSHFSWEPGVGAASHPRSNKNNVELSPSLLDSQSATRPAFTYTFPAILYVNVGWGLPHRADATAGTKAQNLAVLLPPLVGESRGGVHPHTALPDSQSATRHAVTVRQGAPYSTDVLNMAADELPPALKPLTPPRRSRTSRELFQSPTGGGGVLIANGRAVAESCERHSRYDSRNAKPSPICPLPCRAKPAAGEGWGGGNARHVITNATSSSAVLPPPVGLEQLARSATSICSRSERKGRGGICLHTALPDSQPATRHAVTVCQGAPYRADVLNMAADELPPALKPLTPPRRSRTSRELFQSPTGGGGVLIANGRAVAESCERHSRYDSRNAKPSPICPLPCRAKPAAGEGWGGGNARHVITNATSSSAVLPPPVGLEQLARSATSICSRSERKGRGGICLHTALPDSQPATRHAVTVCQGAPYRADVLNMAADELPPALQPLTPPQPSPTGGGSLSVEGRDSGSSINAHNAATIVTIPADLPLPCRAKPAAGGYPFKMRPHFEWDPGEGRGGGSVLSHTALPNSQSTTRLVFTYTFPATMYVNVGWGLPHRADATAGTKAQNLAVLLPPLVGESRGGVRPHTALPDSQSAPCPAFTYTFPAILYVKGATCHAMP